MKCGLVIPGGCLRDSNVCKTPDGVSFVRRDWSGREVGPDGMELFEEKDVLAIYDTVSEEWRPRSGWILGRKCVDPDEGPIIRPGDRWNNFVEILAIGPDTAIEGRIGWLAYVEDDADMQAMEDEKDFWLIDTKGILFITDGGEDA